MNIRAKYTTQLQAGLGLVPETQKLLAVWRDGMSGQELLKAALASGEFPTLAARRLRNIIIEAFCPRYLVENAEPAKLLKSIQSQITREEFRSLCFIFTSRANTILADFVLEVYWPRYAAGGVSVFKARLPRICVVGSFECPNNQQVVRKYYHSSRSLPPGRLCGFRPVGIHNRRGSPNQQLPDLFERGIDFGSQSSFLWPGR